MMKQPGFLRVEPEVWMSYESFQEQVLLKKRQYAGITNELIYLNVTAGDLIGNLVDVIALKEKNTLALGESRQPSPEATFHLDHGSLKRCEPSLSYEWPEQHFVIFSSGSTGRPKLIVHSFEVLERKNRVQVCSDSRGSLALPLFHISHIAGIDRIFYNMTHGISTILTAQRNPEFVFSLIERYQVHALASSPFFYGQIQQKHGIYQLGSLQEVTYGGDVMPLPTLQKMNEFFPATTHIRQSFGLSELGSLRTRSQARNSTYFAFADNSVQFKVVDSVLWIKSPWQMVGLFDAGLHAPRLDADGFYCTGDRVDVNEDNYIVIIGRTDDRITIGGTKIYPQEIENLVMEVELVQDALVETDEQGRLVCRLSLTRNDEVDLQKLRVPIIQHLRSRGLPVQFTPLIYSLEPIEYLFRGKKKRKRIKG